MIQLMAVYRVQDDDALKKRLEVDGEGNVTINSGPLNISFGQPDHAVYFLRGKIKDVVTFEIEDSFFYELRNAMVSQKDAKHAGGVPTFNDATKPGMKIEIQDSEWLERLQQNIIPRSGRVIGGAQFFEAVSPSAFSPAEVLGFADMLLSADKILGEGDTKIVVRQTEKVLDDYGINAETLVPTSEVDWPALKEQLWKIYNNFHDKRLREKVKGGGGGGGGGGKKKKGKS